MSSDLKLNLRIAVNADGSAQVLGSTRDGINGISNASGNASRNLRSMDSAAASVVRTLAPMIGIYELISFGDKVIQDTATVQDLDTRLHSLTATAGDYAKTVDYINTVAVEQHKKLNDLTDSYAKLRVLENSGIITGQQTKGLYEGLNNAASELGAGNDQLKQSFFGLAQGLASGVLHAEELNQVTEPMPGLMNSLDKALGQGAGGFRRLTNDGKITSEMFATTLVKALHDFDGAAAATAQNVNAKSTDISNSWTRLVTSFEPTTSAIFSPVADSAKSAIDTAREFNEVAMTVGETNVSASSLTQGAWSVTTEAISNGWDILKAAGLGAATDTASSWIASGDQMKSNVKFVVNDMIGLFVGLGHSVGIIFGALAINVGNTLDNAIAKASAAAGDVARMGVGDFSFSSSKAVVDKPLVNGWADAAVQLKIDLSTDYLGTFTDAVKGASVAYQGLADEQKKAATEAEQAKAKSLQLAGAHNAVGAAAGLSAGATKKAAAEAKKHADAIAKEIESLNDQHQKLLLSERDYQLSKLAALGMTDAVKASSIAVWDSNQAIEAQKKGIEAGASALDAERDRYDKLTMSANEYLYTQLLLKGVSPGEAIETAAQSSVSDDIEKRQKSIDDARASLESYNKTVADTTAKTSDFGSVTSAVFDGALGGVNTLAGAFDNMINSIDKSTSALEENRKAKIEIDKSQPSLDRDQYLKDLTIKQNALAKNAKDELKYNAAIVNEKLSGTRQIAGAVSSMLKQGSTEQRAAHAIEMGLAGAQIAMQITKMAGIGAELAAEEATVVPYVGAQMVKGEAAAASGIAAQGAIPIAGFALMAAMGVAMAAIGFGKGKSVTAPPPIDSPTTGTVLGDASAASQSVGNVYQLLQDIHAEEYATLRSIDQGISGLQNGITNVITRLFQAGGTTGDFATIPATTYSGASSLTVGGLGMAASIASGIALGLAPMTMGLSLLAPLVLRYVPVIGDLIGDFTNWLGNGLFGGKQTSSLIGSGIATMPASLGYVMTGGNITAQQYAQIQTKTDGGWFGEDEFDTSMQYAALDKATQAAMDAVFKNMGETMLGLADNLGMGLSDRVKNYIIPALTVDLHGLSGEDAAKKLNAAISTQLDTMSSVIFGDILGQYQQLGEGMLETAVRIVSEVAVVKDAFGKSGLSIADNAIAISDALVQAAGGLQEFQKQFDAYYQKFYTDAERNVFTQKQLASYLSDVNLLLPTTRDGYRQLVEALDINNAADQQRYSLLMKLSGAADTYYSGIEEAAKSAQLIADQQRALDIQLMEASGNALGALTEKRKDELAAMDASLQFTQRLVWLMQDAEAASKASADAAKQHVANAMSVLQKSVADEKAIVKNKYDALTQIAQDSLNSLRNVISGAMGVLQKSVSAEKTRITDEYNSAVKATQSSIDNLSNSASSLLGISSALKSAVNATVIPGNERQDRVAAQRIISDAVNAGVLPSSDTLTNALGVVARPSENLFGSFEDYQRDFLKTSISIHDLSNIADNQLNQSQTQLDVAKNQLELMKTSYDEQLSALDTVISAAQAQVDAANGTTIAVMTVKQAQDNLTQAAATAGIQQINALNAQIESYKATSASEISRLDGVLSTAQAQIDAANGTTIAVMSVESAILNLGAAITDQKAQAAQAQADLANRLSAISTAQAAIKTESAKKAEYDAAQARATNSALAVENAVAAATKASQAAAAAAAQAQSMQNYGPAPTTWQSGQTNNPIWEQVLGGFNAAHQARFGIPTNRSWNADADAASTYAVLVGQYNSMSASAAAAAQATAAGLANVAAASAALIPGYQATASSDQAAANQAAAAYATAASYAAAARAAVPGINSFEVGTNYVTEQRWAEIHPGERIMPASDNRELMMRLSSPVPSNNDNAQLITEIKTDMKALRDEIKLLRASADRGNENTQRAADTLAGRQSVPLLVQVVAS